MISGCDNVACMKVIYEMGPKSMTLMIVPYAEQAKELEEKIAIASEAHYTPSVMELELQTRLNQLTDHLIQKQAQVLLFIVLNGSLFSSCKTLFPVLEGDTHRLFRVLISGNCMNFGLILCSFSVCA